MGTAADVRRLVVEVAARHGALVAESFTTATLNPTRFPGPIRARLGEGFASGAWKVGFELPVPDGVTYVPRTHPLVDALGQYLLDTALDDPAAAIARRCGAIWRKCARKIASSAPASR